MKNRVLLENYYLPGDLESQIEAFVNAYNHARYHESLGNLTPADVFFGRDQGILENRRRIKEATFHARRMAHQNQAAKHQQSGAGSSVIPNGLLSQLVD